MKNLPRLAYPVDINFCVNYKEDMYNGADAKNLREVRRWAKLNLELDGRKALNLGTLTDAKGREFPLKLWA
jgi:superfamily I DNA/RNA helicase